MEDGKGCAYIFDILYILLLSFVGHDLFAWLCLSLHRRKARGGMSVLLAIDIDNVDTSVLT